VIQNLAVGGIVVDTVGEGLGQDKAASIENVAVQTFSVETTHQPSELVNVTFERRFSNPERNPYPAWNPHPNLVRNYQLSDVVLDGQFRGLFNGRGFIRGSNYIIPDEQMMAIKVDPARLIKGPDDVTVIIGCNAASGNNYFHWVVQALPAIDVSLGRKGQDRKVALALPVLRPWQEESLQMLGYAGVRRVILDDPRGQYFFNRVEYSEFLRGDGTFRWSEASHRTFSRIRAEVDDTQPADGRKLYVARTDAPTRIMRNEGALIAELRRHGFDIVVPGTLSLNEQVRTFRNASLVVGPHGAGMTNIAFCEPGTIVYELVPADYHNACFCSLAHTCGLRYWADQFHSEGKGVPLVRDWESDTELVMQRLTEIEAIQADLREEARHQTISAMDFLRGMTGRLPDRGTQVQRPPANQPEPGFLSRLRQRLFKG
jgi:hypothetical protein